MNTLTQEQYNTYITAWKELANAKSLSSADHLLYNLVHGRPAYFGFTPTQNEKHIRNGASLVFGVECASRQLGIDLRQYLLEEPRRWWKNQTLSMVHLPKEYVAQFATIQFIYVSPLYGIHREIGELALTKRLSYDDIESLLGPGHSVVWFH